MTNFVDVSSMWLSPTQLQLDHVMSGLSRVDTVFQHVQHLASSNGSSLKEITKLHDILLKKYGHLSEWSQKETLRKSGLTNFGSQYNSELTDPRPNGCQTDVTWLTRVPQVHSSASANEKTLVPRITKFGDLENNVKAGVRHMHDANSSTVGNHAEGGVGGRGEERGSSVAPIRITTKGDGKAMMNANANLRNFAKMRETNREREDLSEGEENGNVGESRDIDKIVANSTTGVGSGSVSNANESSVSPKRPDGLTKSRGRTDAATMWRKGKTVAAASTKFGRTTTNPGYKHEREISNIPS